MACPTTERKLWQCLRDNLSDVHWVRIESGLTGVGIPDINGCYIGTEIWIESKVVHGKQIRLSHPQRRWHERRIAEGGRTFILATDPTRDRLLMWHGSQASAVQKHGIDHDRKRREFSWPVNWINFSRALFTSDW